MIWRQPRQGKWTTTFEDSSYIRTLTLLPSKHPGFFLKSRCLGFTLSRQLCKEGSLVPGKDGPGRCKPNGNAVAICFQFQGKCKVQLFFHCFKQRDRRHKKIQKEHVYVIYPSGIVSFFTLANWKLHTLYCSISSFSFLGRFSKGKCQLSHFRYALSTWACLQFLSVLNLKHHTERLKLVEEQIGENVCRPASCRHVVLGDFGGSDVR